MTYIFGKTSEKTLQILVLTVNFDFSDYSQLRGSTTFRYFFFIIIEPRSLKCGMHM